jgi:hypothetical protein
MPLAAVIAAQTRAGGGNAKLLDIGIYAGKYLSLLMASAGRTNSKVIGNDTFQHQPSEVVKENVSKLVPDLTSILTIFPEPSHAFSPDRSGPTARRPNSGVTTMRVGREN